MSFERKGTVLKHTEGGGAGAELAAAEPYRGGPGMT